MKVKVFDDNDKEIWSSNKLVLTNEHDPLWRGAFEPYATNLQSIIDALSVSINQAKKDETHCMINHSIVLFAEPDKL